MNIATYTKKGFVTRVIHFDVSDANKARMLADMQRLRGESVRVEAAR